MKTLIFDSGPIISLTMNNLLWILSELKQRFGGEFLVAHKVKEELVDKPMRTKKFKFEAIQVREQFSKGILRETDTKKELSEMTERLLFYANNSFQAWGSYIKIVHEGEMQSLALAKVKEADALVMDERTTRMIVEDVTAFVKIMNKKLHTKVKVDKSNLRKFQQMVQDIRIIRSIELATIAYELGLFEKYKADKKELLDALLWGVKLNGCSVTEREIKELISLES